MQSFKKYMTYKKDFNAIILHLLRGLVNDSMQFEEIVSGSTANLDHIDIKVDELQSKVIILAMPYLPKILKHDLYLLVPKVRNWLLIHFHTKIRAGT